MAKKLTTARITRPASGRDQPKAAKLRPESPSQASKGATSGRLTQQAAHAATMAPAALAAVPTAFLEFCIRVFLSKTHEIVLA